MADGIYYIKSAKNGKYFDVENPASKPLGSDINVITDNFGGNSNQQWRLTKQSDGTFSIRSLYDTNYTLDVYGWIDANETNVQAVYSSSSEYKWRIIKNSDGTFRIMPSFSSTRGLDVYYGSDSSRYGKNVQLCNYEDGDNQNWIFEETGFWDRGYSGVSTKIKINIIVEDSALTTYFTPDVYKVAEKWNGISSNIDIKVYTPGTHATGIRTANITIQIEGKYLYSYGEINTDAVSSKYFDDVYKHFNWAKVGININTSTSQYDNTLNYEMINGKNKRKELILHEVGHALKLSHPPQEKEGNSVVSVMRNKNLKDISIVYAEPTEYDKTILKRKWGN